MMHKNAQHPWSHLAIDFTTDLPTSKRKTTILVIVDWFFKSLYMIPLLNLPTAFQTKKLMHNHGFRYFGLPEEYIVSDQGTQFTSHVWKILMGMLGVTISLMSVYHSQGTGQVERAIQEIFHFLQKKKKKKDYLFSSNF